MDQIISQLTMLIIVVVAAWIVLFQKRETKFDLLQILMERDKATNSLKPSYIRFGSIVCLGLLVWVVKESVSLSTVDTNIKLIVILGLLAFAPKAFQKFAEKYADWKK